MEIIYEAEFPIQGLGRFHVQDALVVSWSTVIASHTDNEDILIQSLPYSLRNSHINNATYCKPAKTCTIQIDFEGFQTAEELLKEVSGHDLWPQNDSRTSFCRISSRKGNADVPEVLLALYDTPPLPLLSLNGASKEVLPISSPSVIIVECVKQNCGSLFVRVLANKSDQGIKKRLQIISRQAKNLLTSLDATNLDTEVLDLFRIDHEDLEELYRCNDFAIPRDSDTILDEINRHAVENPHSISICTSDWQMTYQELIELSTKLAARLEELGVSCGPASDTFIPMLFEKSGWTLVAIVAALKLGAAFVLLDPTQPFLRLKELVSKLDARTMLCSAENASLSAQLTEQFVVVERASLAAIPPVAAFRRPKITGTSAAYVIFTSGSTGTPKGAVIEHGQLSAASKYLGPAMTLGPSTRMLQFSSYTFDSCINEMVFALAHGCCVCVPTEAERMNDLVGFMNATQVTHAVFTPSFLATLSPREIPSTRHLLVGGEKPSVDVLADWASQARVTPVYGPAECCVITNLFDFDPENAVSGEIGPALCSRVWVVDRRNPQRLAAPGVVGELVIQGPTVGRGYLGDEEKTNAAFYDSFEWAPRASLSPSSRFYRTGDLVRYTANDTLVYLGRKQGQQVKLRGRRIETGEIEHWIHQFLPAPMRSKVELIQQGKQRSCSELVAFIAPVLAQPQQPPSVSKFMSIEDEREFESLTEDIRKSLAERLPAYMIPPLYIPVTKMPLTKNGKTDTKRLIELASESLTRKMDQSNLEICPRRLPSTKNERVLHQAWARLLECDENSFGAEANFVRLGGNSLLAMQLAANLRKDGLQVAFADIITSKDLSVTATKITKLSEHEKVARTAPFSLLAPTLADKITAEACHQCGLTNDMLEDIYPCTPAQTFYMNVSQQFKGEKNRLKEIYQIKFSIDNDCDVKRLRRAWDRVILHNYSLRTRIISVGDCMYQVVVHEKHDWLHTANLDGHLDSFNGKDPFTFGKPLMQLALAQDSKGCRTLVWVLCHAIFDAWSIELTLKKVIEEYIKDGSPIRYSQPQSFVKFVTKQNSEHARRFWRQHFEGAETKPLRKIGSPCLGVNRTVLRRKLAFTQNKYGITPATSMFGAWAIVTSQYTKAKDVCIFLARAGRDVPIPGIEDLVAPTLTRVPLRMRVDGRLTTSEFLSNIQQSLAQMLEFQHVQWDHISGVSEYAANACENASLVMVQQAQKSLTANNDTGFNLQGLQTTNPLQLPISMIGTQFDDHIEALCQYDSTMFKAGGIHTLFDQIEQVFGELCRAEEGVKLAQLDISLYDTNQLYV